MLSCSSRALALEQQCKGSRKFKLQKDYLGNNLRIKKKKSENEMKLIIFYKRKKYKYGFILNFTCIRGAGKDMIKNIIQPYDRENL